MLKLSRGRKGHLLYPPHPPRKNCCLCTYSHQVQTNKRQNLILSQIRMLDRSFYHLKSIQIHLHLAHAPLLCTINGSGLNLLVQGYVNKCIAGQDHISLTLLEKRVLKRFFRCRLFNTFTCFSSLILPTERFGTVFECQIPQMFCQLSTIIIRDLYSALIMARHALGCLT